MKVHLILLISVLAVVQGTTEGAKSPQKTKKDPAKILFVAPFGSKSHKMFYQGIIDAVAEDGHQVTVITPYKSKSLHKNIEEIVFEENDISLIMANAFTDGFMAATLKAMEKGPEQCFTALTSQRTKMALENENFDLAFVSIFFNECFLGVLHDKKIPFVFVNPAQMFGPYNAMRMGNPVFPSFSYNPMLNFMAPLTFYQRAVSTISLIMAENLVLKNFRRIDATYKHLGLRDENSTVTTESIAKEASALMVNSIRLEEEPKPYMPNIISAGSIHCREPKPLTKDLEQWVSKSGKDGFILFSIGSALRAGDIPEEKERILAKVFSELPQQVVWKYDADKLVHVETPKNVKLLKWCPQQDLLGHPSIKLFITHGGIHSTQEALYHSVPVVGIPVFGDQEGNMAQAEAKGYGVKLSWSELTEERLRQSIQKMLSDQSTIQKVKEQAALMRDTPLTPQQEVVWWTNYLLRHRGAKHLRSPAADLKWYELYNADVWAALLSSAILSVLILLKCLQMTLRRLIFGATKKGKAASKKKKSE